MAKRARKKGTTKDPVIVAQATPRWRILPPEIIFIIVRLLKDDQISLRACSLAAREFSQPALSCIGRHITVNYVPRIRLCAYFLTHNSGFQHVRSLDLGVIWKCSNDYLEEQLTILEIFAQRQSLTRLWLSKFPFPSIEPGQRPKIQDMVSALASTVTDLGLYECAFASYVDMISFVRAFSHCDSLHIRDCVTGGGGSGGDMFYGLPEHVISVDALELGCTSNGSAIDVSSLIEDADLDVSQLSDLTCTGFGSAEQARSVAISTSASSIVHFQIVYTEKSGFLEAFLNPMAKNWSLESFEIELPHGTDDAYLHRAFQNFPTAPHLKEFTISCHKLVPKCWMYFHRFLRRVDLFPRLNQVDIRIKTRQGPLTSFSQEPGLDEMLFRLGGRNVTLWGVHQ